MGECGNIGIHGSEVREGSGRAFLLQTAPSELPLTSSHWDPTVSPR